MSTGLGNHFKYIAPMVEEYSVLFKTGGSPLSLSRLRPKSLLLHKATPSFSSRAALKSRNAVIIEILSSIASPSLGLALLR